MDTRDQVLELFRQGVRPSVIAKQLGISRQRVYQILDRPERQKRGRKSFTNEDTDKRVRAILGARDSWTWAEAAAELSREDLLIPAMKIYDYFRELGFKKGGPGDPRWTRKTD